jgi:hypothetical protein
MKNKVYLFLLLVSLFQVLSCKKDSQMQQPVNQQVPGLETGLLSFSINGQLLNAIIDTEVNTIRTLISHTADKNNVIINFSLANQVNAFINNIPITSGSKMDISKLVYLTVSSADKKRSTTFQVITQTDLQYFGLVGDVVEEKSLNKDYNYYFDQFDGSTWSSVNCGPAVATMAIKWADSTFSKRPGDARAMFSPDGGDWSDRNIGDYLHYYGITNAVDTIGNLDSLVKTNIDKNQLLILCLDWYYISYNPSTYQHINKPYPSTIPGTGHFLLVKGYKQMPTAFYLEIYDPWSQGRPYFPGIIPFEPIGQDRYYLDTDIKKATDVWDTYVTIVASKGQKIVSSIKSNSKQRHLADNHF